MKSIFLSLILLASYSCFAQADANSLVGKWLKLPKKDLIIEIEKKGDIYQAKIHWALDSINRPVGFLILDKLEFDPKNQVWENGSIADPRSGKKYNASVEFKDENLIEVHAYKGMKFLGTTRQFQKVP